MVWRLGFSIILTYIVKRRTSYLKHFGKYNIDNKILNFSMIILIISMGMIFIIGNNGLRYIGIVNLLGYITLESKRHNYRDENQKITRCSKAFLLIGNMGCLALYLYDMGWGSGSLKSFVLSALTGYLSRIL